MRKLFQKQYWPALLAVAALVVMICFTLPEVRRLSALRSKTAALQHELEDHSARLRSTEEVYSQTETMRRRLMSFDQALPGGMHLGEFLEDIHRLAAETGLHDHHVVPRAVVDGEDVSWMPLDLDFKGSFEAVYAFLRQVEAQSRVVRVQRMELTASGSSRTELQSSLTLYVYFRRSPATPTGTGAKG